MIGVKFGNVHSFYDWRVYYNGCDKDLPNPRRITIDVALSNGLLDVTSALTDGRIFYESRKLKIDFKVIDNPLPWPQLYSKIARDIHGKSLNIVFDTDKDFYWEATNCVLGTPKAKEDVGEFSIECDCYPFKKEIRQQVASAVVDTTSKTIAIKNLREEVNPDYIYASSAVTMTLNGKNYSIPSGYTYDPTNILLLEGINNVTFTRVDQNTTPTVYVVYRRGEL